MIRGPRAFLLVLVLGVGLGCRDLNVVTGAYATIAEAEQAGAIRKGWIPAALPKSAHDLREAHDLDRDRRWGLFSFPPSDAGALRAILQEHELSLTGITCDLPARIEWWPRILRGQLDAEVVKAAGLEAYAARQGDLIVAVNWNQGRAYYWTR